MSLLKNLVLVSFCVLCLAGSAPAGMIDNLMGYWCFDGNLLDPSPNQGNGTWIGTANPNPVYVTGKFGQAVNLSHADNNAVRIGGLGGEEYWDPCHFPSPPDNFDFTISMWFTMTTATPVAYQCLIAKGESSTWRISRSSSQANILAFGGYYDPQIPPPTGVTLSDGNWHQLVGVYVDNPGGTPNDFRYGYIDGQLRCSNTVLNTGGLSPSVDDPYSPIIGNNPDSLGRSWDGKIDDVALWNRSLSADEVAQLWNGGAGRSVGSFIPEPSSLVLLAAGVAGLLCYAWRKRK